MRCSPWSADHVAQRRELVRRARRCRLPTPTMNFGICWMSCRVCVDRPAARAIQTSSASAPERSEDRRGERDAFSGMRVRCSIHPATAPRYERDQDAEHQQHKNLSDGLEQPDKQDCQDRRGAGSGANLKRRRRCSASQWLFFSLAFLDLSVARSLRQRCPAPSACLVAMNQQGACPSSA